MISELYPNSPSTALASIELGLESFSAPLKPQRKRPLKYYKNSGRNYTVLYWQLRGLVQMNGVANYTYWNYQQHWHMRLSSLHAIWALCLLFCKWQHFCGPVFALHLMWLQNECWGWVTYSKETDISDTSGRLITAKVHVPLRGLHANSWVCY